MTPETLARRIVCRALDIDPELPSEAIEEIFRPGNARGAFAVGEAERAMAKVDGGRSLSQQQLTAIVESLRAWMTQDTTYGHLPYHYSRALSWLELEAPKLLEQPLPPPPDAKAER